MKSSLADTMKSKRTGPAGLYKQLRSTRIVLRQVPENTPDHIIAVADHPPIMCAQRRFLEAIRIQSTHHRTIVTRKNFALHALQALQRSRPRDLQEDTPVWTTDVCKDPYASHLAP